MQLYTCNLVEMYSQRWDDFNFQFRWCHLPDTRLGATTLGPGPEHVHINHHVFFFGKGRGLLYAAKHLWSDLQATLMGYYSIKEWIDYCNDLLD